MMHIDYKLDRSSKHGIGLFANENVEKNGLIYTASPLLDLNITKEQFEILDNREKKEIEWWGFFDESNDVWHVDFDVSKFINHSYKATLTQEESEKDAYLVATRNIKNGEELTQNYLEFEKEEDLRKRDIS